MGRSLLLIVCLTLSLSSAYAQTDMSISGRVRCGRTFVDGCMVVLLQPSDSSMVAYTMTDKQGRYSLHAVTALSELLIKVTGFNVKRQLAHIKACSQTLDFSVEEENMVLREVVVKSRKLWGNRDTLNYLVSAYTRDRDRTIGDVLRQLPGITIEDNGVIRYQGTPINHFYIENLDMLQGRYNLATQGVKAEDVATVQVMENHEHVRALQDQTPTERAAINLKLKDKAKGVWTKTADLGAGGYADGPLWDATLQMMYLGKSRQHMMRYGGNNVGRDNDAGTVHYGIPAAGGSRMVDIVGHGSPPVGNGMFGYRHGLNLNNLVKFSDHATLNYNFNYSHTLLHGNSFSRTTYLLPDGSERLLTEDIADRNHTNSAHLQLIYEKNAEHRFLNNTLSIFGQWNKGRGNILSNNLINSFLPGGTGGASSVSQVLHYRSLGITNRTRLVLRTPKGGGFEWTSTNSMSSTPQALAIGGSMAARQDIDLTSISTLNGFEMLRDLRSHNWTLSASAHLNATYTTLNSRLTHPDAPTAAHGDMGHLHGDMRVGPIVQYVNGTFQSALSFPIDLTYTRLDNANMPDEQTDASRLRLYLQPSLSLTWKATGKFTFYANANYSADETTWRKLFTASVMQNYRSLSRYRATLNDSYHADAHFKVSFKDIFNSIFAHLEGGWKRSWSNVAYGTTLDAKAHSVVEAAYMPNHSSRYTLTAYGRKDIDWHTIQMELSVTGSRGENEMLRQSVLTTYRTTNYILHGTLAFDLISGCRINYQATWQRNRSVSANHVLTYGEFSQRGQFNLRLVPSRLFLNLHASHTHNKSLASGKKDYVFIGAGLQFKWSKQVELNLNGDNLTNIHTYTTHSLGDLEETYTEFHLRPRSVILTAHLYL
ncbi:MAG: hypothetical protein ACTTJL_08320 [Hoylesella enoeca]|uniref:hypothetical protein n=1 Tax=Hoylesella enoeca TaxID=76123 RepID=UPI003F9EF029